MSKPSFSCPGPVSRRHFLKLGSLALGGAGLSNLLGSRAAAKEAGHSTPDTSVIFLWLPGGPPHMETYDMKPDAPTEYRGDFRPIRTKVPGLDVCELLPLHAQVADKFAFIRSIAHNFAGHGDGMKHFLTGREPGTPDDFVTIHPMVGSMVAKCREQVRRGVPNYIAGHRSRPAGHRRLRLRLGLPRAVHAPVHLRRRSQRSRSSRCRTWRRRRGSPSRLPDRLGLLRDAGSASRRHATPANLMAGMDLPAPVPLTCSRAPSLARPSTSPREPARLRERYGMHAWGQRCLLARRLVEHGASFVTMVLENPYQSGIAGATRTASTTGTRTPSTATSSTTLKHRLPIYDRCVSALIEDLYARGLDKKVLLIVTGEFGRTPRIGYDNGHARPA